MLIDLQDVGARFYTYESAMAYFLEAAGKTGTPIVVLDRPAMVSGVNVGGPVSDAGTEAYVSYMQEPMTLGMTLGELAGFFNGEQHLGARLTVVPMQNWQRGLWFDQTGVPWVNPSPNLQSLSRGHLVRGNGLCRVHEPLRGTRHRCCLRNRWARPGSQPMPRRRSWPTP